ncbi:hypothetical protein [Xenorhabdus bharatensis]|uniref:hypothetical protein n=1 Tax=Xenorhabdus bharatensis TaxID=3136256 RepID=UPI0030F3BA60
MSEERTFLPCKCGGMAINCWYLSSTLGDGVKCHYFKCRRCMNEGEAFDTQEEAEKVWKERNGG